MGMAKLRENKIMDKEYLTLAAQAALAKLPDNHEIILMAVPLEGGDGRLKYISSLRREDAIAIVKEWLLKCGAAEDWMKHIK